MPIFALMLHKSSAHSVLFSISVCALLMFGQKANAQSSLRDSVISMFSIDLALGVHSPVGDLAERFGESAMVGASVHYKTASNWQFGLEGGFIFGSDVKEPIAQGIMTSEGFVIDKLGGYTELLIQERGMTMVGTVGKVVPFLGPNPNSGVVFRLGTGLLQHKVRLETRNNDVPQLEGEYLKGYDRLTNGLTLHQFIGYQYMSNKRLVNFTLGIEGYQAFTQSRRDFNFDLMRKDETKRLDSLYGLKFAWNFPIYRRAADGYYY